MNTQPNYQLPNIPWEERPAGASDAVSYTHLTLPTSDLV